MYDADDADRDRLDAIMTDRHDNGHHENTPDTDCWACQRNAEFADAEAALTRDEASQGGTA